MYAQTLRVSFQFKGWDGQIHYVDGECRVSWDEIWDEGAGLLGCAIYGMELTSAAVDGEELSWAGVREFANKFGEDYEDELRWIVESSIASGAGSPSSH